MSEGICPRCKRAYFGCHTPKHISSVEPNYWVLFCDPPSEGETPTSKPRRKGSSALQAGENDGDECLRQIQME